MTGTLYDFRIGPYGSPLGSLTNVQSIVDYNGRRLYPPQSFGSFLPGAPAHRLTGVEFERGFAKVDWSWTGENGKGYMTYGGARRIRTDYLNGQWSGSLAVYTKTTNEGQYELYDAVATLTKFPESSPNFKIFEDFGIHWTHLVAR